MPIEATARPESASGSKAGNLRRLADAGLPVPPFVVVPADLARHFLAGLDAPLAAARIAAAALPDEIAAAIRAILPGLPADCRTVAVRSSMAGEDGARHAFAGQLTTVLGVRRAPDDGDPEVLAAVRACWASAFAPRVAAYRRAHGLPEPGSGAIPAIEVVVQAMIDADVAGVLFTADPADPTRCAMVLSLARGTGEALGQGVVAGDTLRVDRENGRIDGHTDLLSDRPIRELVAIAERIEALFGTPQDIEIAWRGGELFILQARPITTLGATSAVDPDRAVDPSPAAGSSPVDIAGDLSGWILWDNSNIAESYAGLTSPLTFSVIRRAYAGVYRQFLDLMGAPHADPQVLNHLLGYYQGRVYYQLQNWYAALAALPGFRHNRRFMEQMMGARPAPAAITPSAAAGMSSATEAATSAIPAPRSSGSRWRTAAFLLRLLRLHRQREARMRRFLAELPPVLAELGGGLDALDGPALAARYRAIETQLLGRWQAPILTDFLLMIDYGLLDRLCTRWLPGAPRLTNDLLVATGRIESTEPLEHLNALAEQARRDPAVAAAFADHDPGATLAAIRSDPALAGFATAFDDYLDRYGDRCMDELKLEAPSWRDDPTRLVRAIAGTARSGAGRDVGTPGRDLEGNAAPMGNARSPAEVRGGAEARLATLPWPHRTLLGWLAGHTLRAVRDRENARFARTRVFGLLRRLFRAAGRHLAEAGVIDDVGDVFFLTEGEIWDFVGGTATTLDLRGLVALRRAEHAAFLAATPPDRFETDGVPYVGRLRALDRAIPLRTPDSVAQNHATGLPPRPPDLAGTPCAPGRVTGRARVMGAVDAADALTAAGTAGAEMGEAMDLGGDILVAERTDPGWVFLFPTAAALLVERGSPLSHAAIVARELGLPTVVNVPGLTRRVRTGDWLTVDGATGAVWVGLSAAD